jgi:hypothetical protein
MAFGVRWEARRPLSYFGALDHPAAGAVATAIVGPLLVVFVVVTVWQRLFGLP